MSNDSSANGTPATSAKVTKHTEKYPSGKTYATWSDGIASDGRTLLEGPEAFFYPNGKPMWTISFQLGEPIGEEIYYREDGSKEWQKTHAADGAWTWQTFDPTGKQTAESHWRNKTLLDVKFPDTK